VAALLKTRPRPAHALVLAVAPVLVACAPPQREVPPRAAVTLAHADPLAYADPRVGTYVSSDWGFSTTSYWIEGPDGVVVVDTQFLPSAAREMADWVEAATGKRIVLAVVLHANPDKYDGTEVLRSRGVPVVTSAEVRALIPEVHAKRKRAFYSRYAPDFPAEPPLPDSFGDKSTDLHAGGLTLHAHVMGPGCSDAHVVLEWEGHVFVGDLVASRAHSWLELGHTTEWLQRLEEIRQLAPKFVHPGRGLTGGPELLDAERAYLEEVIAVVAEEKPRLPIDPAAVARAKEKLVRAFPAYGYDVFLDIGLPAEMERQAKAAPAP
jgi:glyoxylase-like metal-dependent hydrolase (beta-lactamase superfamily II)